VNLVTKASGKTKRGGPICSLHKKIEISRACETKLGCVLSFLENAINKILIMKRTFSRGLNVTGRVKLVPELKTIGLG